MDKKNINKLLPLLSGILSRMKENIDYFQCIEFKLKSGNKFFPAEIIYFDGMYIFSCGGRKEQTEYDNLQSIVCDELKNYDEATIYYKERGCVIVLTIDSKGVHLKQTDSIDNNPSDISTVQSKREYIVNPSIAPKLLKELGILAENGKIKNDKIRKYNQIDYFIEIMGQIINEMQNKDELLIIDCACGKSYLSFVLNFYLRDILKRNCKFIGVDRSSSVIKSSKKIAERLGYANMTFIDADLVTYIPQKNPDIVISLHACDIATDMALGLGIRSNAKAIVSVPCCHKDILKQYSYEPFSAVTSHGILKARLADTLTDALRASYLEGMGYNVKLKEYISPLETPKNIMIKAIKKADTSKSSMHEYQKLKRLINVEPAIERFSENINSSMSDEMLFFNDILNKQK